MDPPRIKSNGGGSENDRLAHFRKGESRVSCEVDIASSEASRETTTLLVQYKARRISTFGSRVVRSRWECRSVVTQFPHQLKLDYFLIKARSNCNGCQSNTTPIEEASVGAGARRRIGIDT